MPCHVVGRSARGKRQSSRRSPRQGAIRSPAQSKQPPLSAGARPSITSSSRPADCSAENSRSGATLRWNGADSGGVDRSRVEPDEDAPAGGCGQLDRQRADDLVERRLGRAIADPAAEPVVADRPDPRRQAPRSRCAGRAPATGRKCRMTSAGPVALTRNRRSSAAPSIVAQALLGPHAVAMKQAGGDDDQVERAARRRAPRRRLDRGVVLKVERRVGAPRQADDVAAARLDRLRRARRRSRRWHRSRWLGHGRSLAWRPTRIAHRALQLLQRAARGRADPATGWPSRQRRFVSRRGG